MSSRHIIVSGWNNGSPNNETGSGYGIRIPKKSRDKYFERGWKYVVIEFDDGSSTTVKISPSFWRSCPELRSSKIGKWMLKNGLAPWSKGNPPILKLEIVGKRRFRLIR